MPTPYKVYATALAKRLKEETERKGIILRTQTRFFQERNGDNGQYICYNYVANRQISKKERRLVVMFVERRLTR